MPIGESILAVKPGIVADARDDFSIGGAANYFLDKANHVTIMHDDGSYGIYAHILYGSLNVNIGERVLAGQVLARIGNTGYSTGPHLHFVLRYNSGKGAYSIPFKFNTKDGQRVPKQGQYYSGVLSKIETSK
jgi:murein DD-endopeptidase MepM/ murein hydrolase activator NlpD